MIRPLRRVTEYDVKRAVIANAVGTGAYPVSIGDAIQPGATGNAKYVTCAAATSPILGIVTSLIVNTSKVTEKSTATGVASDLLGAVSTGPGTTNQTYLTWSVEFIPSYIPMEYEMDISAVAGSTTDSSAIGGYFNLLTLSATPNAAGDTNSVLDEGSIAIFTGTQGQFVSYGYTPYNTKKVFGKVSKVL
jgi:hypothetical protein